MASPSTTYQFVEVPGKHAESVTMETGNSDMSGKLEEVPDEEVDDVFADIDAGPSKLDSSLFAADSFEDLSSEVFEKKIDGECSSRTQSFSSTGSHPRNSVSDSAVEEKASSETMGVAADVIPEEDSDEAEKEVIDEARLKRAESIVETQRQNSTEDPLDPQWTEHKKHVFILSEAGKPIYTRYGNEENLVTMMGLLQAIVSFVQDDDDSIKSIVAGEHKFVFLVRGPIILVAVCSAADSQNQLVLQLTYVYHQVLSVLTFTQLTRIFEHRRNYDLRKLLAGTEKFIDNLLNLMSSDPSFLLQSVRCLPLAGSMRDIIGQALQHSKAKELVFAILIVDNQLVTMVRPKKFSLHPSDLHLIFNLVSASTAFQTAESWTPICLPRFDNSGYLYAHVSYLDDNCPACLLLLSTDRNAFFTLSECKMKIMERLEKHKCIEHLSKAAKQGTYSIDQIGIPELWHFIYKSKSTSQFTSPEIGPPYITPEDKERLYGQYLYLHHRIHSSVRPLKMLCYSSNEEMLIGFVTSGFELYASFSPLTCKSTAMNAIHKLLRWIRKEEEILFILNSYTF